MSSPRSIKKDLFIHVILAWCQSGKPGSTSEVHLTKPWIWWRQACCCMCHLQMSPSLEIFWSRKNQHLWPYRENNSLRHWSKLILSCFIVHKHLSTKSTCSKKPKLWKVFEYQYENCFLPLQVSDSYKVSDNNEVLAYWLSNSAMLVCVLQRTFRSSTMLSSKVRSCKSNLYKNIIFLNIYLLQFLYNVVSSLQSK